jgi:mannose-6-phosphate isomerase-like protein (cupin superfamily)
MPRMRRIVTGIDSTGRSCIVSQEQLTFEHGEQGVFMEPIFNTDQSPPPPRPPGQAGELDLGVGTGLVRWMVVRWPANGEFPMHHTDTVDFDTVLEGSIEVVLDDGAHALQVGDCVVVTGVDHAWRSGPDGCTMSVLAIGTPPPS